MLSRDFKKAVSPCRQELWKTNFDLSRFRGTGSIKSNLQHNDDIIVARSRGFGKIL